jgi:predicted DNA-binding transcriptional regulator YafY
MRLKRRTELRSQPPLERMQRIFQQIKNERLPNCSTLAEKLEVSAKTIQRDVDFMRDRMELPIEYDSAQHGFYFTAPVASFPAVTVSEAELVSLFVARKAVEQYSGTAFEKPLATAFAKLTAGLTDEIEFNWQELDSEIAFRSVGLTRQDLALFETVAGAIRQKRELEFEYRKIGGKPELRRVQPLGLLCVDGQWYLRSWDLVRRDQRTFHLGRMKKAKALPHTFERPVSFDVNEAFVNSIGVFEGKRVEQVVLRFHGWAAQVLTERTWHPSQKVVAKRDGSVELSLKVAVTPELERWVWSWGDKVEVLRPLELCDKVKAMHQRALGAHDKLQMTSHRVP